MKLGMQYLIMWIAIIASLRKPKKSGREIHQVKVTIVYRPSVLEKAATKVCSCMYLTISLVTVAYHLLQ